MFPLSSRGRTRLKAALRLSFESVDRVISSPLGRSMKTASIIAETIGKKSVEAWDELREVDFGEWEGLTVPQIRKGSGGSLREVEASQVDVTATNGENPISGL